IFSREAAREVDRRAVADYGIPSIVLMENAAIHSATLALDMLEDAAGARVLVFCGPGNNGGDGLAIARHLHNAGVTPEIILAAPAGEYRGDAATNLTIATTMKLPIVPAGAGS